MRFFFHELLQAYLIKSNESLNRNFDIFDHHVNKSSINRINFLLFNALIVLLF